MEANLGATPGRVPPPTAPRSRWVTKAACGRRMQGCADDAPSERPVAARRGCSPIQEPSQRRTATAAGAARCILMWWGTPRGTRAMAGRRWRPSRRDCTSAPARRPRVRARRGCRRAAKGRKRTDQAAPWVECGAGAHVNGPERTTHLHRRGGGVHNPPAAPSAARRCTLYMEADTLCPKAANSLSNRPDNTPTRFTTRTIPISPPHPLLHSCTGSQSRSVLSFFLFTLLLFVIRDSRGATSG